MAQELFRTRCKQGKLIITDEYVRTELAGGLRQATLYRQSLTGVESKLVMIPLFGLGGGTNLIFHGQGGEMLHADLVKPKVAKAIVEMLQPAPVR